MNDRRASRHVGPIPRRTGADTALQTFLDPAAAERIRVALGHTHSRQTREAYGLAWRQFSTWTEEEGLPSMPSTPESVAAYLTHRAESVGMSSLTIAVAAVASAHKAKGYALPSPTIFGR